ELRPDVPPSLDALCARMLAKEPRDRPGDGAEVAQAIRGLSMAALPKETASDRPPGESAQALTFASRSVLSVVLSDAGPASGGAISSDAETHVAEDLAELRRTAQLHGGHTELLVDGSILITWVGTGVATDQAAQAARCGLAVRAHAGDRAMAL